jgi:hypothetical protein
MMATDPDLDRATDDDAHELADTCRALLAVVVDARALMEALADETPATTRREARATAVRRVASVLVRDAAAPAATIERDLSGLLYRLAIL